MAKTSAETTLGEDIHTRTTGDSVESQAVVLAIDGSDSVVPADATHGVAVAGGVASEAADSGNPVKVGGVYNSGGVFLTDGDRGDLQVNEIGYVNVAAANDAGGGVAYLTTDSGSALPLKVSVDLQAEDAGHVSGDSGYFLLGVRNDSASTTLTDANGDYSAVAVDNKGRLIVTEGGGSLTVDGTFWQATQPISGTVTVNDGTVVALDSGTLTALETITIGTALPAGNNNIGDVDMASIAAGDNNIGNVDIASIAAGDNNIGNVDVVTLPALPAGTNNIGDVDVLTLPNAATATLSNVGTSNASATLLASNTARKGAVIYNDSLVVMYVKFGTTASWSSFTYYLAAGATLELPTSPGLYTGRIDGILASSTGNARITELT